MLTSIFVFSVLVALYFRSFNAFLYTLIVLFAVIHPITTTIILVIGGVISYFSNRSKYNYDNLRKLYSRSDRDDK